MARSTARTKFRATAPLAALLALWLAAVAAPAAAQEAVPSADPAADASGADESIVLNFEAADIREVIYSFAAALNINYWLDPRVQGQVTVRTTGRISKEDLFPVFHQLLRSSGFAAVKNGEMYLIVPAEEGKTKLMMPGRARAELDRENHFVMEVIKVRHVNAEQMANTISPFVSPGGDVVPYPRSNLVVITDLAENANRLTDLVSRFDTDTFSEMSSRVYPIEHAVLEDLATELQSVLEAYQVAESGSGVFIIPLLRLNALAVISFDAGVFVHVEYWLSVLDVPAEAGTRRQVYVYQVENSKAVDIAGVLSEIYSDGGGGGRSSTRERGRSSAADEAGVGLGGGLSSRRSNSRNSRDSDDRSSSRRSSSSRSGGSSGGSSGMVLGGGESEDQIFEQEVRIVEDEATNSLVILATPRDYQTIREVLRQLDIIPRQVLIEVLVAEISLDDSETFSINNAFLSNSSNSDAGSGTDPGGTFFDLFGEELNLIGAIGSGGLSATVTKFRDGVAVFQSVIEAIQETTRSKILSRPHIMTADNQEARILVGDEVPIITSQQNSNVQGNTGILQDVQYRDTGIIISVLPQVNSMGLVNMELSLEVSDINGQVTSELSQLGLQSPTFTTREAETTVVVNSGDTLVIGGIIREGQDAVRSGVPYLMDLPVLGPIFRSRSDTLDRTELIVLITPFVVRDRAEAESVTAEFKRRVEGVLTELEISETQQQGRHTVILEAAAAP